jgi:cysteine desulfurase
MEVYLDNSATTRPYEEVIETVVEGMRVYYGNPSSAHSLGVKAERKINEAREIAAKTINAGKDEIIFTSGGSESNNFLIKGFAKAGSKIITTKIEHPSVMNTCIELEREGVEVVYLDVDHRGLISLKELSDNIDKDTVLISIMHVNNETGVIQDIESAGKLIKEKSSRARFHVDAVQSYGKLKIDVQKWKVDLLSASGHKIHGPRGSGISYVRRGLSPKPLICGGGQEKNLRSGTENLSAITGFAAASDIMNKNMEASYLKVKDVKDYFINKLQVFKDIKINSVGEEYSSYILSVSFSGVKGEVLLHLLEADGIYVSTGSACSAKKNGDSYVLKAVGLEKNNINGTIRFSFNESNTRSEIDYTVDKLEKSLVFLRKLKK